MSKDNVGEVVTLEHVTVTVSKIRSFSLFLLDDMRSMGMSNVGIRYANFVLLALP